jgi:hypothetical protein
MLIIKNGMTVSPGQGEPFAIEDNPYSTIRQSQADGLHRPFRNPFGVPPALRQQNASDPVISDSYHGLGMI